MKTMLKAAVLAGLSLTPLAAHASLTVTPGLSVTNACHENIVVAVYYKSSRGGWETTQFVPIAAGKRRDRVASSDNSVFYYYAESTSGRPPKRWFGDRDTEIAGKVYPMKKQVLRFQENGNRYHLRLICR